MAIQKEELEQTKKDIFRLLSQVDSQTDYFAPWHSARNIVKRTPELRNDKGFMVELVSADPSFFDFVKKNSKIYADVAIAALDGGASLSPHNLGDKLLDSKEFTIKYAEKVFGGGFIYNNISDRLKDDKEVIAKCIKNYNPRGMYQNIFLDNKQVADRISTDKELVLLAICQYQWHGAEKLIKDEHLEDKKFVNDLIDNSHNIEALADRIGFKGCETREELKEKLKVKDNYEQLSKDLKQETEIKEVRKLKI